MTCLRGYSLECAGPAALWSTLNLLTCLNQTSSSAPGRRGPKRRRAGALQGAARCNDESVMGNDESVMECHANSTLESVGAGSTSKIVAMSSTRDVTRQAGKLLRNNRP